MPTYSPDIWQLAQANLKPHVLRKMWETTTKRFPLPKPDGQKTMRYDGLKGCYDEKRPDDDSKNMWNSTATWRIQSAFMEELNTVAKFWKICRGFGFDHEWNDDDLVKSFCLVGKLKKGNPGVRLFTWTSKFRVAALLFKKVHESRFRLCSLSVTTKNRAFLFE